MRNKIATLLTLIFINEPSAFASKCISLTNTSQVPVQFDSLMSPGYAYTVQPYTTATLSRDHMMGACGNSKSCTVSVKVDDDNFLFIRDVPPGTNIFYSSSSDYYLDRDAHVKCN